MIFWAIKDIDDGTYMIGNHIWTPLICTFSKYLIEAMVFLTEKEALALLKLEYPTEWRRKHKDGIHKILKPVEIEINEVSHD